MRRGVYPGKFRRGVKCAPPPRKIRPRSRPRPCRLPPAAAPDRCPDRPGTTGPAPAPALPTQAARSGPGPAPARIACRRSPTPPGSPELIRSGPGPDAGKKHRARSGPRRPACQDRKRPQLPRRNRSPPPAGRDRLTVAASPEGPPPAHAGRAERNRPTPGPSDRLPGSIH